MSESDYYQILGLSCFATSKQIKDRYRFLCHAYHPDKFSSIDHKLVAENEFKRIGKAYAILSDERQRRCYDDGYSRRDSAEPESTFSVLERIAHFVAPPYPWWEFPAYRELNEADKVFHRESGAELRPEQIDRLRMLMRHETYDVKIILKKRVPPTKVDALVCDLWLLTNTDLGLGVATPAELTPDDVRKTVRIYETTTWKKLRGSRPWTHWAFVTGLTPEEREALASEAYAYMLKNGIRRGE